MAGALDSAWRTTYQFLVVNNYTQPQMDKFFEMWGRSEYWDDDLIKNHTYLGEFFSKLESGHLRNKAGDRIHTSEDALKEWAEKQ